VSVFWHWALGLEGLGWYRGHRYHHYRAATADPRLRWIAWPARSRNRLPQKVWVARRVHIALLRLLFRARGPPSSYRGSLRARARACGILRVLWKSASCSRQVIVIGCTQPDDRAVPLPSVISGLWTAPWTVISGFGLCEESTCLERTTFCSLFAVLCDSAL